MPKSKAFVKMTLSLFIMSLCLAVVTAPEVFSQRRKQASESGAVRMNGSGGGSAPSVVKIGGDQLKGAGAGGTVIVMGVGYTTTFHFEEKGLQISGDRSGLDIKETVGNQKFYNVYIMPKVSGISRNLFFEVPSGSIEVTIETIGAPSRLRSSEYTHEVFVTTPAARTDVELLRQKVKELEGVVATRSGELNEAKKSKEAALKKAREESDENLKLSVETSVGIIADRLRAIESGDKQSLTNPNGAGGQTKSGIKITQVGRAVRDSRQRLWGVLQIETKTASGELATILSVSDSTPAAATDQKIEHIVISKLSLNKATNHRAAKSYLGFVIDTPVNTPSVVLGVNGELVNLKIVE